MPIALTEYEISMGRVCNAKCVFCTQGEEPLAVQRFIPPEEVYRHIDHAAANGYEALAFLGGEVTINRHFPSFVAYGRDKGFKRIDLCTHGAMLHKLVYVDELIAAGLTRVTVSIHAHTAELEDAINRREGFFERKIAGLKNLVMRQREGHFKDGVSVNPVVNRLNYHTLPQMAVFFTRLGVRDIRFNCLRHEGQTLYNPTVVPRFEDIKPYLEKVVLLNETRLKTSITFGDFPFCVMPDALKLSHRLFAKYTGRFNDLDKEITIYRSLAPGQLGYDNFKWEQSINNLKRPVAACQDCRLLGLCHGPWFTYVGLFGEGEFSPITHDLAGPITEREKRPRKPLTPINWQAEKTCYDVKEARQRS